MLIRLIAVWLVLLSSNQVFGESLLRLHSTVADGPEEAPARVVYSRQHPVIYVLADDILVYRREADSSVTLIGQHRAGAPQRAFSEYADHDEWQMVLPPDERHLYVINLNSNSVTVWSITDDGETLQKEDVFYSGQDGYIGLRYVLYGAFNSDGSKLYFTSEVGGIAIFDRDIETGALTEFRRYDVNDAGWEVLEGIYDLAFSVDGKWLFVTTAYPGALLSLSVSPNGELAHAQTFALPSSTDYSAAAKLLMHPTLPVLYVSGVSDVRALSLNLETGVVDELSHLITENPPTHHYYIWDQLSISSDGSTLYLVEVDAIQSWQQIRTVDLGLMTGHFQSTELMQSNFHVELGLVYNVAVSPEGNSLMVAVPSLDSVAVFNRENGFWFRAIMRTLLPSNGGPALNSISYLKKLRDGRSFIYSSFADQALAEMTFDAATNELFSLGEIQAATHRTQTLKTPKAFAVSPDEQYVYLSSHGSDSQEAPKLSVFKRTGPGQFIPWLFYSNNDLGIPMQPSLGVGYSAWLWVSEDGKHLYLSIGHDGFISRASGDEVLMRFRREQSTGALAFEGYDILLENGNRFDGSGAYKSWSTVQSKKENLLYVSNNYSLQVLRRNPETGVMTRLQWLYVGNTSYMAASDDESTFYLCNEKKIRIFSRNFDTDLLTETGSWEIPSGYHYSAEIEAFIVHPGGRTAFVAFEGFEAPRTMIQLARDDETGALTTVGEVDEYERQFQMSNLLPMLHLGHSDVLAVIGWPQFGVDSSDTIHVYEYAKERPQQTGAPTATQLESSIQLIWSTMGDAQEFKLYRSDVAGEQGRLLYRGSELRYVDSAAQVGVTYYYSLKQCNEMGCSPTSAQASFSARNQSSGGESGGGGGGGGGGANSWTLLCALLVIGLFRYKKGSVIVQ